MSITDELSAVLSSMASGEPSLSYLALAIGAVGAVGAVGLLLGWVLGRMLGDSARRAAASEPPVEPESPRTLSGEAFLAYLSHELRTPLTAIIGYSEMLQEDAIHLKQRELLPDLQRVQSAGQLLLGLVDDAVDLWRIESGSIDVIPVRFDLGRLVAEVLREVDPMLQTASIRMDVKLDTLPTMRSDRMKVRRVIANVLGFLSGLAGHGTIWLEGTTSGPDRVVLSMSHIKLSADHPQLESLKHRIEGTGTLDDGVYSSGMGIVVAVELCRILGGDLQLTTDERGVVLVVTLPAELETPAS